MRLTVRKSGEVIVGMTELEAVTLVDVIAAVVAASNENPDFFNRTQKAVVRDLHKQLAGLDEAIEDAEKRGTETADEATEETAAPVSGKSVKVEKEVQAPKTEQATVAG